MPLLTRKTRKSSFMANAEMQSALLVICDYTKKLNSANKNDDEIGNDILRIETKLKHLELEEVKDIPFGLHNVESPFIWLEKRFCDVPSSEVIAKAIQYLALDEDFGATFPFEKFIWMITLAFEYSNENKEAEAGEQLRLCNQLFKKEEENNNDDVTFNKLREALKHTLEATTAYFLFRAGKLEEAEKVAATIVPVSNMSIVARATIEAMKAQFFYHYRSQGASLAVQHARNALSLDPDEPLWQILTAGVIRRQRKFRPNMEQVSDEEITLLERAVAHQRAAKHLVLLAHAYREHSDVTFKIHRSEPNFFQSQTFHDISDMQAKAFELYKEALLQKPHSEAVNRLCGYGLLKLPAFKSDYRLAERCLQTALELSPNNSVVIHSLGLYYYKSLMDYEKAALFCEKAGKLGNFSASLDMLRMKRLVYENTYDPCFDFTKLLQLYGDNQTKRHEILCQMGSYYLFFERNLSKALTYFKTLVDENAEMIILTNHKCTFLNMACKINLLECIVNEGTLLLQENPDYIKEKKNYDMVEIENFLNGLKKTNPKIFDVPIKVDLIDSLHKVSDDIKQTYIRKKERRDSGKEKRKHSFNSRRRCSLDDRSSFPKSHHENGTNYRRRSSGNISDVPQYRLFRSSSSKSDLPGKGSSNNVDSANKTTQETDKSLVNSKKRYEFYKTNGYHMDSSKYRRKSVSNLSDDVQKRLFRNQSNNDFKEPILEGVSASMTEGNKSFASKVNSESEIKTRIRNRLPQQTKTENRKQKFRKTSWDEYSNNKIISENWRKRDNI